MAFSNWISHYLRSDRRLFETFASEVLNLEMKKNYKVFREEKNVDILLEDTENVVVIENKIKSRINGVRHDDYSDKVQSQLCKYWVNIAEP